MILFLIHFSSCLLILLIFDFFEFSQHKLLFLTGTHLLRHLEGNVTPLRAQGKPLLILSHSMISFILIIHNELDLPGEVLKGDPSSHTGTGMRPTTISKPCPELLGILAFF